MRHSLGILRKRRPIQFVTTIYLYGLAVHLGKTYHSQINKGLIKLYVRDRSISINKNCIARQVNVIYKQYTTHPSTPELPTLCHDLGSNEKIIRKDCQNLNEQYKQRKSDKKASKAKQSKTINVGCDHNSNIPPSASLS